MTLLSRRDSIGLLLQLRTRQHFFAQFVAVFCSARSVSWPFQIPPWLERRRRGVAELPLGGKPRCNCWELFCLPHQQHSTHPHTSGGVVPLSPVRTTRLRSEDQFPTPCGTGLFRLVVLLKAIVQMRQALVVVHQIWFECNVLAKLGLALFVLAHLRVCHSKVEVGVRQVGLCSQSFQQFRDGRFVLFVLQASLAKNQVEFR
jgi:hypothetical protein